MSKPKVSSDTVTKFTILVLFREDLLLNIYKIKLEKAGYIPKLVRSIGEAKTAIKLNKPNAIIADVFFENPGKSTQFFKKILSSASTKNIPVIATSRIEDNEIIDKLYKIGIAKYISLNQQGAAELAIEAANDEIINRDEEYREVKNNRINKEQRIEKEESIATIVLAALSIPTMLLNFFGGIISAIWLIILGQWGIVLIGFIIVFIAPFAAALLLLPTNLTSIAIVKAYEKGKYSTLKAWVVINNLLQGLAFTIVSYGICAYLLSFKNEQILWPLLIWTFGVALSPWSYMASKERQEGGSSYNASVNAVTVIGIGLLVVLLTNTLTSTPLLVCFVGFWIFVSLSLTILALISIQRLNPYDMKRLKNKK